MSTTIWKFPIELVSGVQRISMPKDAKVLTIQSQFEEPMMWAEVDPSVGKEERQFEVLGTGHEIQSLSFLETRKYISTFQTYGGNYVYHAFEIVRN